jgi:hypothetical protein
MLSYNVVSSLSAGVAWGRDGFLPQRAEVEDKIARGGQALRDGETAAGLKTLAEGAEQARAMGDILLYRKSFDAVTEHLDGAHADRLLLASESVSVSDSDKGAPSAAGNSASKPSSGKAAAVGDKRGKSVPAVRGGGAAVQPASGGKGAAIKSAITRSWRGVKNVASGGKGAAQGSAIKSNSAAVRPASGGKGAAIKSAVTQSWKAVKSGVGAGKGSAPRQQAPITPTKPNVVAPTRTGGR